MSALAAVHIKRRQLCIEDEDWRDLVERVTGQRSTRSLKPPQLHSLLAELDRLAGGRETASTHRRKHLQGPYAAKLRALWISCWNLGLITARDDGALIAFVRRQTRIDQPFHGGLPVLERMQHLELVVERRRVRAPECIHLIQFGPLRVGQLVAEEFEFRPLMQRKVQIMGHVRLSDHVETAQRSDQQRGPVLRRRHTLRQFVSHFIRGLYT